MCQEVDSFSCIISRVGVDYEDGMFSLSCDGSSTLPFLSNIDKAENFVHLLTEFREESFYLKIHNVPKQVPTKLAKHSVVKFVQENTFSNVLARFGSHQFHDLFRKPKSIFTNFLTTLEHITFQKLRLEQKLNIAGRLKWGLKRTPFLE